MKLMLVSLIILAFPISATTGKRITIRLLDAKSGKPIKSKMVAVDWNVGLFSTEILVSENGQGAVDIPRGATELIIRPGHKTGDDPYRIAYENCNADPLKAVQLSEIESRGYVPANRCGRRTVDARPGEVVFWAATLPWWKPSFR